MELDVGGEDTMGRRPRDRLDLGSARGAAPGTRAARGLWTRKVEDSTSVEDTDGEHDEGV